MSREESSSQCSDKSDSGAKRLATHNPNQGPSVSTSTNTNTNDDSGFFLSPQPFLSKLVRCASTPLSEKSLQSLLNLDFDYLSSERYSKTDLNLLTANLSSVEELPKSHTQPLITRVNLDHQDDSQECQELSLSFKCPDSSKRQTSAVKRASKKECRSSGLGSEFHSPSDSGFNSDFSLSSILSTSAEPSSGATSSTDGATCISSVNVKLPPKDRDIFDLKKKTKRDLEKAATRPLHRGARYAHIPGILKCINFRWSIHWELVNWAVQ